MANPNKMRSSWCLVLTLLLLACGFFAAPGSIVQQQKDNYLPLPSTVSFVSNCLHFFRTNGLTSKIVKRPAATTTAGRGGGRGDKLDPDLAFRKLHVETGQAYDMRTGLPWRIGDSDNSTESEAAQGSLWASVAGETSHLFELDDAHDSVEWRRVAGMPAPTMRRSLIWSRSDKARTKGFGLF